MKNDLISRQDAKDAVDMALDTIDHVPEWVYDILLNSLDKVPSASTELSNNSPKLDNENGDLISRQEAIEAMCGVLMGLFDCPPTYAYKAVEEALEKLPSASTELSDYSDKLWKIAYERGKAEGRKKGKWIEQDAGGDGVFYECSVCKDAFILMEGTPSDNNYNFCPNCGSYNGGEET